MKSIRAKALEEEAHRLASTRDVRGSIAKYGELIAMTRLPVRVTYLIARGNLLSQSGRLDEALLDFSAAISAEPNVPEYYLARAEIRLKQGRPDKAIGDYSKYLALRDDVEIRARRAELYRLAGRNDAAYRDLYHIEQSSPGRPGVAGQMALLKKEGISPDAPETLDALLEQLDALVGLAAVKAQVHSLVNFTAMQQQRSNRGLSPLPLTLHLVFTGNPGTGKTTVARLVGKIFQTLRLLSKGHLIEVDRAGLVAGYVGQTALKVTEVVERSLGGILFIDEAYSLAGRGETDYGREAIDTLLKAMEDHRADFVVIVAGYPDKMEEFLDSNPGMRSRFTRFITFEDYSDRELLLILNRFAHAAGYIIGESAQRTAAEHLARLAGIDPIGFGNARGVRTEFERAIGRHADRLARRADATDEELSTLVSADFGYSTP